MRNQLATEMWEALNRFHLDVQRPGRRRRRVGEGAESASRFCMSVVEFSQLLQGITDSTMPREEGWYSCRRASSSSAPSGRRACSTSTTACSWATTTGRRPRGARVRRLRRAALGDAAALALGLRVLPPHLERRHPAERRDRAAHALARAAALDPLLGRRRRGRTAPHHRTRRLLQRPEPMPGATVESNARREIGRLHAELAYQRLNDLFDQGAAPLAARGAAPLLSHRRVGRARVLRPSAR